MLVLALSTYRCPRIPSFRGLHHFPSRPGRNALITIGIIIAGIIKRGGEKSRNQYRIPFAAVVKTREMEGRGEERRGGEGRREGMEAGRGGEGAGEGEGGRCGGGVVMCE